MTHQDPRAVAAGLTKLQKVVLLLIDEGQRYFGADSDDARTALERHECIAITRTLPSGQWIDYEPTPLGREVARVLRESEGGNV